jgi:signal peptidase I
VPMTQLHVRLWRDPHRQQIVVFRAPLPENPDYIKRLIGLPGDKIQMRAGALNVNGVAVPQRQVATATAHDRGFPEQVAWMRETNPEGRNYLIQDHGRNEAADNTGVYVVPPHCYFMMGDNRDNSSDSRFDPGLAPEDPKLGGCGWDSRLDAALNYDTGVGFVPEDNLVGKAQIIILSWNENASIFKPWTWVTDIRPDRFFRLLK